MSARFARNTIAVLLVILYIIWGLSMGGCTTYKINACPYGTGAACTTVETSSWRSYEAPAVDYERREADGSGVRFRFNAVNATQPWAGVASEGVQLGSLLLNTMAYCKAYPSMCTGQQGVIQYSPTTLRRAETFCTAFPSRCEK